MPCDATQDGGTRQPLAPLPRGGYVPDMATTGPTIVPERLQQEVETIAARAAAIGRPLTPMPTLEIATNTRQTSRAFTGPLGSTDTPRVRLAQDFLDTAPEERAWTIAHELSHVLHAQEGDRPGFTRGRLTAAGALLAIAVAALACAGYAELTQSGPGAGWFLVLALVSGIGMCMVIFAVIRREEIAADATAVEVFGEVLTVAGVQRLRRREGAFGAFAELPLTAVRTHPRPSHRRRAGLTHRPQPGR